MLRAGVRLGSDRGQTGVKRLPRFRRPRWLSPAWFDEARLIVQEPHLRSVLDHRRLAGRVLNAGCGEGLYAPLIEAFDGVRVIVNMDLSYPSIARCRPDSRHRDTQGSLDALPFVAESFDAVVCTEVLEHVPDDRAAARELARVLAPGGLLLLSVPTPPAPFDPAHAREGYVLDDLRALLAPAGLDIVEAASCFHLLMRVLYKLWHAQQRMTARNLFPRFALRATGHLDRLLRFGRPWDLVVACVKTRPDPLDA